MKCLFGRARAEEPHSKGRVPISRVSSNELWLKQLDLSSAGKVLATSTELRLQPFLPRGKRVMGWMG